MISKASVTDVDQMKTLIDFHASKGLMLPRSMSYLYENIRDYFVFRSGELVIGCCAIHISWKDIAEIKSLAVDPRHVNKGVGKALLQACVEEAKKLGIPVLFTLTMEPEFFKKLGFKTVSKEKLPMKIWGECMHCSKYPECDEEALVFKVS
ncbi:MAG: N-acetyltransferase [Candidatus Altiarchaeota archaeon]